MEAPWPYGVVISHPRASRRRVGYTEDENGCWIFNGYKDKDGYGRIGHKKPYATTEPAHRFFYRMWKGEIPAGKELDHKCRVRPCVNPEHLRPVTHAEHMAIGREYRKKTHCKRGHLKNLKNSHPSKGTGTCKTCHYATKLVRTQGISMKQALRRAQRTHHTRPLLPVEEARRRLQRV